MILIHLQCLKTSLKDMVVLVNLALALANWRAGGEDLDSALAYLADIKSRLLLFPQNLLQAKSFVETL